MKAVLKVLALGAALAASSTMAKADQLSGTLNFGPTIMGDSQYSFTMTGTILSVTFNGGTDTTAGGNPVLSNYASSTQTTLGNFSFDTATGVLTSYSTPEFSVVDTGANSLHGTTLSFYDTSSQPTVAYSYDHTTGYMDITLYGVLTDSNLSLTPTIGSLFFSSQDVNFTAQGGGVYTSGTVSYSGTITALPAATPEPSSLALLGTSLLGAAGIARRRLMAK